ncbi:glycosyltransferase family 4 protein [Grimontia kaedaensis]|uniref:Glycosyltransferase family 4 protein n=1 Tax=Grimontia kaedaensis TaxID=2872157 RepID=A0ABY4WUM3_9GAMM|nr:glycosyltransferase family 1 protein [Grimontia kaedaensis]USH03271.1 glycosyltransferase family 4 protein [Grimontia kaedaensis]
MQTKILINVNSIRAPLTGIGYYTLNIAKALLDKDVDVVAVKNGTFLDKTALLAMIDTFSRPESKLGEQGKLKALIIRLLQKLPGVYKIKKILVEKKAKRVLNKLSKQKYVYFEPSFIPLRYSGQTITTVHDLSFISHPEFHPKSRVEFLTSEMGQTIATSDHIVVDSDFILEEMHSKFPSSVNKSSTLYLGVEPAFRRYSKDDVDSVLEHFKLSHKNFILSVATLEPRKNLARLVEAYSKLPAAVRQDIPLVLAGGQGWKMQELLSSAQELVAANQIVFTGYLADQELKYLYSAARLFAYPSLYEGFGLPIVEAMASGTPVLTSSIGATAEVAGPNAVLVNPYNVDDIYKGLNKAISDTAQSEALACNAFKYVKMYDWNTTADRLLGIVKELA